MRRRSRAGSRPNSMTEISTAASAVEVIEETLTNGILDQG
jgi:hypothetical protein